MSEFAKEQLAEMFEHDWDKPKYKEWQYDFFFHTTPSFVYVPPDADLWSRTRNQYEMRQLMNKIDWTSQRAVDFKAGWDIARSKIINEVLMTIKTIESSL
jgi:hypothetical protein